MKRRCLWMAGMLVLAGTLMAADDGADAKSVQALAKLARPSVAVITQFARDGSEAGVGTGFVVASDGLIATSLHVIGEARRITVRLAGDELFEVTGIHAWDRSKDLAVIRVEADGLPVLELGDSDQVEQGAPVVAMGNPLGLEKSIVNGVVSAKRELEGMDLIQVAIPIEPGNSGGPLLDMEGRVQGILNMKSAMTANLGFATPINALKRLLERPNPVAIERWVTVGGLNSREWRPLFGASWRRKAGTIRVEGEGSGFGGRALCLYERTVPEPPYEVAVTVRLAKEDGAAGLVFASDGDQRHYGFYPSAGNMRLTRFDGPSVFSWDILEQARSDVYRPGEWNRIKVRFERERILCYVNDELTFETRDRGLTGGKVGLAKFRDTVAEFRSFQLGTNLDEQAESAAGEELATLREKVRTLGLGGDPLDEALLARPELARRLMFERARELEEEAAALRAVTAQLNARSVQAELSRLFAESEERVDLFRAVLLVAKLDLPELDMTIYERVLEEMVDQVREGLAEDAGEAEKLAVLRRFLFEESGFHGTRQDYYNRANSYMTDLLDDREGLPLTLSVLFLELGRRVGLEALYGVGLPRHFVVKHVSEGGETQLIDVFDGGRPISRDEAAILAGTPIRDEYLEAATKRDIVVRMLNNLLGIALEEDATEDALRYLDTIIVLRPDSVRDRGQRAVVLARKGDKEGAKADLEWILAHPPDDLSLGPIEEFYRSLF